MPTLKKFRCHVAWVDACMYDMPLEKSWAFASTLEDIRFIASQCIHAHTRQSIRGTKDAKQLVCRIQALASVFAPKLSRDLSVKLSHWLQSSGLGLKASIAAHIMQEALGQLTLGPGNAESLTEMEPGQPLRLNLLQAQIGDKGLALVPMLKAGVSTGVQEPIPSSFQWPKKAQPHQDFMPLETCRGNWSAAEAKPSVAQAFINKEIASGWVQRVPGADRWPRPAGRQPQRLAS